MTLDNNQEIFVGGEKLTVMDAGSKNGYESGRWYATCLGYMLSAEVSKPDSDIVTVKNGDTVYIEGMPYVLVMTGPANGEFMPKALYEAVFKTRLSKAVVEVSGGVVQEVYSNDPDLQVDVLDYDNLDNHDKCDTKTLDEIDSLHSVM